MKQNRRQNIGKLLAVCTAVLWGISLWSVARASSVALLTDNFNTTGGLNADQGTRQTGIDSPANLSSYQSGGGSYGIVGISNNQLEINPQGGGADSFAAASYDKSFTDAAIGAQGLHIQFDLNLYDGHHATDGQTLFAISLGQTSASRLQMNGGTGAFGSSHADLAVILRNNGEVDTQSGGNPINLNVSSFTTAIDQIHHVDLFLVTANFNQGTPATVALFVDGTAVSLGSAGHFGWDADVTDYISLEVETIASAGVYLDNLDMSTIPEPGLLSLLALGGAFLVWRRRQATWRA